MSRKILIITGANTAREINRFEKLNYKAYYAEMAPMGRYILKK